MADPRRLSLSLDEEHAEKLARLAERVQAEQDRLAEALLARAMEDADADGQAITELLDGIDGAYERAQLGLEQARRGQTTALDDL